MRGLSATTPKFRGFNAFYLLQNYNLTNFLLPKNKKKIYDLISNTL